MNEWFLAQVKPNADRIARRNLERQGFSTFQPLEKHTIVRGGRVQEMLRPYFGGYVFLSYPSSPAPWYLVNSTYAVVRLVKLGDRPTPVPPVVLSDLRASCDQHEVVAPGSLVGERINVEASVGSLKSFVGKVGRLSPDERALVLLDFMGNKTRVILPTSHIRVAQVSQR